MDNKRRSSVGGAEKSKTRKVAAKRPSANKSSSRKSGVRSSSANASACKARSKQRTAAKKRGGGKKKIIAIACVVAAILICVAVVLGVTLSRRRNAAKRPLVFEDGEYVYRRQDISYAESDRIIDNPDQGFYRPIGVRLTPTGIEYNKNIVRSTTRLYHLRVDISAFSGAVNGIGDAAIEGKALDGLDELFRYLKSEQKNAVVRFAYDVNFGGAADLEPSAVKIIEHIAALSTVLDRHTEVITAVEVGMFGPWGEMHTSKAATGENISAAIDAFLNGVRDVPVLVRTPKMIYRYLGITIDDIDEYTIAAHSPAYRLGLFDDGYLGSSSDLGTYTDRAREIPWIAKQTAHLPFGGEVVVPDSPLHNIDNCTAEMFAVHLSYLNIEWNDRVIDKWKNTTYTKNSGGDSAYYGKSAFDYIRNRMGYRLVVTDSVFAKSKATGEITLSLKIDNVGFGNLTCKKQVTVYLTDGDVATAIEGGEYDGGGELNVPIGRLQAGKEYGVYVALHSGTADSLPEYSIEFANADMWSDGMRANYVGKVEA